MQERLVSALPIHAVLPGLLAALRQGSNAVLVAPPGAGKTTAVAPALLDEDWCTGEILLLSPRRLAARAAAERMAELAGEKPGETIGYATRLDSRRSARTRILVLTEGIFLSRIQADAELEGVSAVLFDEVHERSLDSDFGLALALDAQAALRPDLKLLAMSATLDGARFARLMGGAPVIESQLIENAAKYGGGRVFVTVAATPECVEIEVEDDGKGIPQAERQSIFDRGARLDVEKPGTGLGLAIVRDVAEIYGGSIRLEESEDLGGLLARLKLPLCG
jgi:signal transduction histidine kinase